jgi:hypothetical protein
VVGAHAPLARHQRRGLQPAGRRGRWRPGAGAAPRRGGRAEPGAACSSSAAQQQCSSAGSAGSAPAQTPASSPPGRRAAGGCAPGPRSRRGRSPPTVQRVQAAGGWQGEGRAQGSARRALWPPHPSAAHGWHAGARRALQLPAAGRRPWRGIGSQDGCCWPRHAAAAAAAAAAPAAASSSASSSSASSSRPPEARTPC